MLEMNFEMLHHLLTSLAGVLERMRAMHRDACQLTTTVSRQSLEFGQTSLSTVREARLRARRHPIASAAILSIALYLIVRFSRGLRAFAGPHQCRLSRRADVATGFDAAFASTALDAAWPKEHNLVRAPFHY